MIFILLPAYNEEDSLDSLFQAIQNKFDSWPSPYKIIICDDGSTDRTHEKLLSFLPKMPLEILSHKYNRGLGETSRDLFERAAEISDEDDIIIRMDCDDTHEPKYFETFIQKLGEGYDVVIASRFVKGGSQQGVGFYRSFVSRCATLFMKTFFPVHGLKEYTCGFRAYRASIIMKAIRVYKNNFIQLKGLGFTCTLEKIVKLKMLNAKFAEIPFVLRYDKKRSPSKMMGSITTFGYFTMALLYHWPWGGWRRKYKKMLKKQLS
jgi:dolichol-phosphate mannosyltransferase